MPDPEFFLLPITCDSDAPNFLFGNPCGAFDNSRCPNVNLECAGVGFLPVAELDGNVRSSGEIMQESEFSDFLYLVFGRIRRPDGGETAQNLIGSSDSAATLTDEDLREEWHVIVPCNQNRHQ